MFRKRHSVRLLAVVGATALMAGCSNGGEERGLVTITVSEFGYFEIVPASNLHFPGTINSVRLKKNGQMHLNQTCDIDRSEIMDAVQRSPVPQGQWKKFEKESVNIKTIVSDFFFADAESSELKGKAIVIKDPEILVIPDDRLQAIEIRALQNPLCAAAVRELVTNGTLVCQIRAALKGDVLTSTLTKRKDDTSVEVEEESVSENSAEINITSGMGQKRHTSVEQMFFAARLHPHGLFFRQPGAEDGAYTIPKCPQL